MSENVFGQDAVIARRFSVAGVCAAVALLAGAPAAMAQYATGLECEDASDVGVALNGQDAWYLPAAGGVTHNVHTYAGNTIGVTANPDGGAQFASGQGSSATVFARSQRDFAWATGVVELSYDVFVSNNGTAANNIGSFSSQPYPGGATYIHLFSYVALTDPNVWQAGYLGYTAAGVAMVAPGTIPAPEWSSLKLNTWYRFTTVIDYSTNQLVKAAMTNLDTMESFSAAIADTYLEGGTAGGRPHPTGIRFFGGPSSNRVSWDNVKIGEATACEPGGCGCVCNYDTSTGADVCDFFDFITFQDLFAGADPCGCELDTSTGPNVCDFFDFIIFQDLFSAGC